MAAGDYILPDVLKDALHDNRADGLDDELYQRAVTSASRLVDEWAGRYFHQDPTPTTRLLRAAVGYQCHTGDFATTTGMTVETETSGVWTAWGGSEWIAEPLVRFGGEPFTKVVAVSTRLFPVGSRLPRVRVTAQWGWEKPPQPIVQATQILATLYFRAKDLTGAELGLDNPDQLSADPISLAKSLVEPYAVQGGLLHRQVAA